MNENYNISSSPHIRAKVTSGNIMLMVVIALLPATIFGIYNFRHENAWLLVVVTTVSAVLAEYIYEKLMHKPVTIKDWSAVVTGLLLALNLPPTLPLVDGCAWICVCNYCGETAVWRTGTELHEPGFGGKVFPAYILYRAHDLFCI